MLSAASAAPPPSAMRPAQLTFVRRRSDGRRPFGSERTGPDRVLHGAAHSVEPEVTQGGLLVAAMAAATAAAAAIAAAAATAFKLLAARCLPAKCARPDWRARRAQARWSRLAERARPRNVLLTITLPEL